MRKSIFVTGAGSGIGAATAQLFAERGWLVGLHDVDGAGLARTEMLIDADRRVSGRFDVCDPDAWRIAVDAFGAASGGAMRLLFNNAGIGHNGAFEDTPQADAARMIDVNLKGVVNGIYAALPLLKRTPGARIVNTASAASIYGTPNLAIYSATKFAVRGLTEALDIEFAGYGIRCVCLMPWFIDTPLLDTPTSGTNRIMRQSYANQKIYPAGAVAEAVWRAAHSDDLYVAVGKEVNEARFAARFFPGMVRRRLKKMFAAR